MTQFTASEMRAEAHRHANEVEDMLNAFADLLEAQEKAVPVAWRSLSLPTTFICDAPKNLDCEKWQPLYTHLAPSDAERLAEALDGFINTGNPRWDKAAFQSRKEGNRPGSGAWMQRIRELLAITDEKERSPVYQHRRKSGPIRQWFDCSAEEYAAMEQNVFDMEHFDRRILYTHPAPADAGEVIRIHPDVAKAQAIPFDVNDGRPTRSAQAQPPAASVTDAMVNAAMRADFCGHNVADALMCGTDWNTEVMRAALEAALAAQENPNGL